MSKLKDQFYELINSMVNEDNTFEKILSTFKITDSVYRNNVMLLFNSHYELEKNSWYENGISHLNELSKIIRNKYSLEVNEDNFFDIHDKYTKGKRGEEQIYWFEQLKDNVFLFGRTNMYILSGNTSLNCYKVEGDEVKFLCNIWYAMS